MHLVLFSGLSSKPVHVAFEKDEIIVESKVAGTHDLSAKVGEYCAIVPSRPATHERLADLMRRAGLTACRVSPGLRQVRRFADEQEG